MNENDRILLNSLKSAPEIISNYISAIPEKERNHRRRDDFWTIREHLIHLIEAQNILYERILRFKNEPDPVIKPYFPENDEINVDLNHSIHDLLDKFRAIRKKQADLLESLDESDFEKKGVHDEYFKYDLGIIMNHILFHDYWHMYRIEELWLTKDNYLSF